MINLIEDLRKFSVVPVVAIDNIESAIKLGSILVKNDLPLVEVTFRTEAATECIKAMSSSFPTLIVGAGTVLNVEQAKIAIKNGAQFIVMPCYEEDVINFCVQNNIPVIPGIVTPTELNLARKKGLKVVKFFPAENFGGLKAVKSLSAPFKDMMFLPTGGINAKNLEEYLLFDKVIACGGTWLAKKDDIDAGNFTQISKNIMEAVEIVKRIRK